MTALLKYGSVWIISPDATKLHTTKMHTLIVGGPCCACLHSLFFKIIPDSIHVFVLYWHTPVTREYKWLFLFGCK